MIKTRNVIPTLGRFIYFFEIVHISFQSEIALRSTFSVLILFISMTNLISTQMYMFPLSTFDKFLGNLIVFYMTTSLYPLLLKANKNHIIFVAFILCIIKFCLFNKW